MRPKASGALQTVVEFADCDDDDGDYQGCGDDNGDEKHDSSAKFSFDIILLR